MHWYPFHIVCIHIRQQARFHLTHKHFNKVIHGSDLLLVEPGLVDGAHGDNLSFLNMSSVEGPRLEGGKQLIFPSFLGTRH